MVSSTVARAGRFEPLSSRSASASRRSHRSRSPRLEPSYLAREIPGFERRGPGPLGGFFGRRPGAGCRLELDELPHRPGEQRDQSKAAVTRIVDVFEAGEREPEIAPAHGVDELPYRALTHANEASRDGIFGDGSLGADVEREALEGVGDARELGTRQFRPRDRPVPFDGCPRNLASRTTNPGSAPRARGSQATSQFCLRAAAINLRRPSILVAHQNETGGGDRSRGVVGEAIERAFLVGSMSAASSASSSPAARASQRSSERTTMSLCLAIMGAMRAAESTRLMVTSPATTFSSLNCERPEGDTAARKALTTRSMENCSSPATRYTG